MSAFDLDHVGVGGRALEPLAASYQRLGFTLTPMARHRGKSTGNRCIMLREGYLELIAIVDPDVADDGPGSIGRLLERYAGLQIIALGIEDTEAELARLRAAGLAVPGIAHLERRVDEADPASPIARFERLPLPDAPEGVIQLIRHLTREAIWQPGFMVHANQAVALDAVVLAVPDPAEAAARLSRLAGLPVVPDAVAGFALPLARGLVRLLPPAVVGQVFPGVSAPALPSMVGMVVRTADGCAALRPILAGLAVQAVGDGVLVAPDDAGGAALLFT